MKTIIETIQQAIDHEQWSVDYHSKMLEGSQEKKQRLELELAELKVKFSVEENTFHLYSN